MMDEFNRILDLGMKDRVFIVTGAAMGVGNALIHALDAAGAVVAAVDIETDLLHAAVGGLREPARHMALVKDLGNYENCESIAGEVFARYGRIDGLVNNAAVVPRIPTAEVDADMFRTTCDINLRSQFLLCRSAGEIMKKAGYGRIINMSSQGYFTGGFDNSIVYSAFKGASVTMTKGFARQFAPFGITVNAVAPGPINTRMMAGLSKERLTEFLDDTVLMKRMAETKEIALPILFLASEWAGYMTGVTLDVNGGMFMK
jgi:NAD(P)-dependent dehydrogenase (short-subunit alcohol dehydrogenase family)